MRKQVHSKSDSSKLGETLEINTSNFLPPKKMHTQDVHYTGSRYNVFALAQGSVFPIMVLIQPTMQRPTVRNGLAVKGKGKRKNLV